MTSAAPQLKLHARLYCGDAVALGPGKADLLEAIAREGSISAAGRALGMSYRRTWMLVDVMNRCWHAPLVETIAGGGTKRGARLTDLGREILGHYRALQGRLEAATACEDVSALTAALLATPRPRAI